MKILVTGAGGFIGKNLCLRLQERQDVDVLKFERAFDDVQHNWSNLLSQVDFVFHLAGVNRVKDPDDFMVGNAVLTKELCDAIATESIKSGKTIPVVFASSTQAVLDNEYGKSKRAAEKILVDLQLTYSNPVFIYRLPNIFGKWSKPNYNSVVATFCHNISRGLPVEIHDTEARLSLIYIDDVISSFMNVLDGFGCELDADGFASIKPQFSITVGEIANLIKGFHSSRKNLTMLTVGTGFLHHLYSTYVSYLPTEAFSYSIPEYKDSRGTFIEFMKLPNFGQVSCLTARPGVTRGGHYHHTKTEKFLVIKGFAKFRFRHILTGEYFEINANQLLPEIVETIPGWAHDLTNVGCDDLVVLVWANEIFDRQSPDTYSSPL